MADLADIAAEITEDTVANAVRRARDAVLAGTAGECDKCEWWMPRLIDGRCGFCRDGRQRPPDWEPPPRPDVVIIEPAEEIATMPAKSIQLPASAERAIQAVESLAASSSISFGHAAAQLIEQGLVASPVVETPADHQLTQPIRERLFAALDVVAGLAADMLNQPDASAATVRADAAEAEAVSLRETLDLETARANAAVTKLDGLRAALAD